MESLVFSPSVIDTVMIMRRTVLESTFLGLWQAIVSHDPLRPILTPRSPFPLFVLFPPIVQEGGQGVKGRKGVDVFGSAFA